MISALNITKISLKNKHGPFDQSISGLVEQKEEQVDHDETVLDVFIGKSIEYCRGSEEGSLSTHLKSEVFPWEFIPELNPEYKCINFLLLQNKLSLHLAC